MTTGGDSAAFATVRRLLDEGAGPIYPGAVACVMDAGQVRLLHAVGRVPPGPTRPDTQYDLASLTKPIATLTLAADLLTSGALGLGDRLRDVLPCSVGDATVAEALGHATGLPAHRDLSSADGPDALRAAVLSEAPLAPPGTRTIYSDLGYMALGFYLEARFGAPLDALVAPALARLGLAGLHYRRDTGDPADRERYAPTDAGSGYGPDASPRPVGSSDERRGAVHDANAAALGGVAAHAGLFGDALSVARWADRLLAEHAARSPFGRTLDVLWTTGAGRDASTWRLGLDTPSPGGSTAGHPPPGALGHLGYTGTSVWMVPARRWTVVLLSNRVHGRPDAETATAMRRLRPGFHDAVWAALGNR
ncbi:MAG: beta-lactamase family protein [Myxococcales bacterium]|nr:beta-lactamase family protein [Myxococcales bacterium]